MSASFTLDVVTEGTLRILLTCLSLACAGALLIISHAERQEAALDALSDYKLKPQPVVYDDPDLKLITVDSPNMRDE